MVLPVRDPIWGPFQSSGQAIWPGLRLRKQRWVPTLLSLVDATVARSATNAKARHLWEACASAGRAKRFREARGISSWQLPLKDSNSPEAHPGLSIRWTGRVLRHGIFARRVGSILRLARNSRRALCSSRLALSTTLVCSLGRSSLLGHQRCNNSIFSPPMFPPIRNFPERKPDTISEVGTNRQHAALRNRQ